MSIDRALLARYLRQLGDLGIDELYLDGLTAAEAVEAVTAGGGGGARAGAAVKSGADTGSGAGARAEARKNSGADADAGSGAEAFRAVMAPEPAVRSAPLPMSGSQPAVAPAVQQNAPGPVSAVQPAVQQIAPATGTALPTIQAAVADCRACALHETRTQTVFGEGSATADVVIVGEAPGQEEDRTGRPFVGRAGKLLDLLLMTAGLPRGDVFICNTLKCRPPQNRNPLPQEVAACSGFLKQQLEAVSPRVLVAVGKFAAQALLGSDESITRLRGTVHTYQGTPLVVTYHPAYLLRSPQMTRQAWQDFQLVRRILDEQT